MTPSTKASDTAVPKLSPQIERTLDPCVVLMKEMIGQYSDQWTSKGGIYSLAQGVVYWKPPSTSTEALQKALLDDDACLHMYGPDEGLPELRTALKEKLAAENGLTNHDVLITVGANQAYMNCVLTLLGNGIIDNQETTHEQQQAVVFAPYYFNHVMALQMTLAKPEQLLVGPTIHGSPDLDWLEEQFQNQQVSRSRIHVVTMVNPGNPTGVALERSFVQRAVDLCRQHGCWLVLDSTYEYFVRDNTNTIHFDGCFNDPHVIHIFSFSKSYALAGYRCGYLALHRDAHDLLEQMVKVQDTIPIAPPRISQVAALGALRAGPQWVAEKYATLDSGRQAILRALAPLEEIVGGDGAMYVMAKLPDTLAMDDQDVARSLVRNHGIAVIPGSFCGFPGWIRVCYANLEPETCAKGTFGM